MNFFNKFELNFLKEKFNNHLLGIFTTIPDCGNKWIFYKIIEKFLKVSLGISSKKHKYKLIYKVSLYIFCYICKEML